MGELEEIGKSGWSGKSQLLTGWLCDGWVCFRWFGSGVPGVDRFLCRLPRPADMLFLRLLLNIFSLLHTLRLHLPLDVSDNTHGWLISEIWHYLSLFAELSPPVVSSSSSYQVTTSPCTSSCNFSRNSRISSNSGIFPYIIFLIA